MKYTLLLLVSCCVQVSGFSQSGNWQQRVKYTMEVDMNVTTNRFTGTQQLEYINNSPDTLSKVFYHLYWNAFQPYSMMDARSRELGKLAINNGINNIPDWDSRVKDRIQHLQPEEIGYQRIVSLKMNGASQNFKVDETILEVTLSRPIMPKSTVTFDMEFEAQVPLQIWRSGRDNPQTGVRYSMSQWYPKICEYDMDGWHPTPYVAREFYGVWGDYDISISIDKTYILGGTGYLQNASQVGYGYETAGSKISRPAGDKLTWHFTAPNVHDFMWAADPDFKHIVRNLTDGITVNVLYKNKDSDPKTDTSWSALADAAEMVFPYIQKKFGAYPYKQYSFVNGGDGGMEYPMSTLLANASSIGLGFHELMHAWYQSVLANNETLYGWMDEGFANFSSAVVRGYYLDQMVIKQPANTGLRDYIDKQKKLLPLNHFDAYSSYFSLVKSGLEESLSTPSDFFSTNYAYKNGSYGKGELFLEQLGYIVGAAVRDRILQEYYHLWKFRHPTPNDFIRVAEKISGVKLDWYLQYWIGSTKTIDYGIDNIWEESGKTKIRLRMNGKVPMPLDVLLTFKDGSRLMAYIPQYFMFGEKQNEDKSIPRTSFEPWKWTHITYTFELGRPLSDLKSVEIDPSQRMADINRTNNKLEVGGMSISN